MENETCIILTRDIPNLNLKRGDYLKWWKGIENFVLEDNEVADNYMYNRVVRINQTFADNLLVENKAILISDQTNKDILSLLEDIRSLLKNNK